MTNRLGTLILLALLASAGAAQAQTYPSRTITMVVTASAGGVTDVVARAVGQRLSEKWGQQVVIENRGGGGHILGAQTVAKAAPDGHTLMVAEAGTYIINPNVYPKDKLNYDLEKDMIQITGLVRIHHSLVVSPKCSRSPGRSPARSPTAPPGWAPDRTSTWCGSSTPPE